MMTEPKKVNKALNRGGSNGKHTVGNVNVKIGENQGYYAGSATNMARLFILCNVIWAVLFGIFAYVKGIETGNLETRVEFLERLHK